MRPHGSFYAGGNGGSGGGGGGRIGLGSGTGTVFGFGVCGGGGSVGIVTSHIVGVVGLAAYQASTTS